MASVSTSPAPFPGTPHLGVAGQGLVATAVLSGHPPSSSPPAVSTAPVVGRLRLAAPVRALMAGSGTQFNDPTIGDAGQGTFLEQAYLDIEDRFALAGKRVIHVWPKSGKVDWEDTATGDLGCSFLDSNDPAFREMKAIYGSLRGGKDNKERLHDLNTWTYRPAGYRGDANGPKPLQKSSDRLERDFKFFRNEHYLAAIEGQPHPPQQIEILRRCAVHDKFRKEFLIVLRNRKRHYEQELQNEPDVERRTSLEATIQKYGRLIDRFDGADHFAIRWALTHPIRGRTPHACERSYQRSINQLTALVGAKHGELVKPGPLAHALPGGAPFMRKWNSWQDNYDNTIQPKEKEYIEDAAALALAIPVDLDSERHLYHSIRQATGAAVKGDSLELALVKLTIAIDTNQPNPEDFFADHPDFESLISGLPPGEQRLLKGEVQRIAAAANNGANQLRPAVFAAGAHQITAGMSAQAVFDNFCAVSNTVF